MELAMKPTSILLAEHTTATYHHTPEFQTSIDEVLGNDYWEHLARKLRPGDEIKVFAADATYYLHLVVRAATRNEVVLGVLSKVLFKSEAVITTSAKYDVKYRGPSVRWSVMKVADGSVIRDNFQTQEEAEKWLTNHDKAMAA
jgi:hypothetical protein